MACFLTKLDIGEGEITPDVETLAECFGQKISKKKETKYQFCMEFVSIWTTGLPGCGERAINMKSILGRILLESSRHFLYGNSVYFY